jgi:hypothetical protein
LIWAITLLLPPKAACLVPVYAGYEENLAVPPNALGRNSIQELVKLTESGSGSFFWGSGLLHLKSNPTELRASDESWAKDLDQFKEKTIVVFMALHGGSDREGAYLLPADSNGRVDEKNRLRVAKVLDRLSQIKSDKNKVLILDTTQISADWPLGILDNGFARELANLESKISGIPNLVVLSASDADQRSWVSEEWRQTVFAHFVIEGLKGAADPSGRINALNLCNYVQKNVTNWVRSNRNALQQPVLLPSGQQGKDRAANMDLVVVKDTYLPPNPKEIKEFTPPDELLTAWKAFEKLQNEVPSPAVYTPNLWRQYQEYLLRYELLIRADDKAMANTMADKLKEVGSQINETRAEKLKSAQNMIPMPAAAGLGRLQPDLLMKQFNDLWEASSEDWGRKWDGILKSANANSTTERQLLRVQIGELLIRKVAENPAKNLDQGDKLAKVLEDKVSPRPAELHFLRMLNRDKVGNAAEYYAAIKAALELRLLAEKTAFNLTSEGHPYSERVYPWIKTPVELADDFRRMGQDLLFASNPSRWSEGLKSFKAAEKKYLEAREVGSAVRAGLAARDQAYEILPALSKWAALRRPSDQAQRQSEDSELFRSIGELWQEVHRLDRQLEKPNPALVKEPPKADLDDPKPLNIADRSDSINRGLKKLRDQFKSICEKLAVSSADLQIEWHDTEAALTVPFIEPSLRMRLISSSRRTSLHLLTETGDKAAEAGAPGDEEKKKARKEAENQGRMALASLGKTWFELCKSPTGELDKYSSVLMRMDTPADDGNWANSISVGGSQIGIRWQQMPEEINARGDGAPKLKLGQAQETLEYADQLARIMDAGAKNVAVHDPVEEYRRLLFLSFLNWQAQRTYEDHWFDVESDFPAYYQETGKMLLDDAAKLVPQPERQQALEDLRKKLGQKGRLEAVGEPRINLTSELAYGVTYRVRPPKDETIPHGFPVVGVNHGPDLEFVDPREAERDVHELTGNDQPLTPISVRIRSPILEKAESNPPPRPEPVKTKISLDGLYRGQRIPGETPVNIYPLPELAQVQPQKPERASLAVRADPVLLQHDPTKSAVMLMLDCSGSMCTPYDPANQFLGRPKKDSRFDRATEAIGKVLAGIKKGTNLSFWVFSDRAAGGPVGRVLRKSQPWDRDQKDALMKQILNLHPWFETPLVRSIWEAKQDFDAANLAGFKSMIVLTDGKDSEFDKDNQLRQGGNTIPQFLANQFKNSGIQLNFVFYEVPQDEQQAVLDNFKCIEEKTWPTPGKMYMGKDSDKMTAHLIRALSPNLRYWVENPEGTAPPGLDDSLEVSQKGSNYQWIDPGLVAKSYNLWAQQTGRDRQKILFDRGDLLLLQLTPKLKFERLLFSSEDIFSGKIREEQGGWRLTVLQNQKVPDRALQMLTTLERLTDQDAITLQQVKPHEAWFEIQPADMAKGLFGVRQEYQYGYPAAAWGFNVPDWPQALGIPNPASPRVQVWWSEQEADSKFLQQGQDFSTGTDLKNLPIPVEDEKVVIESVLVEDHLVQMANGQKPVSQPCLVVRMAYPPNKPVWAKVTGQDKATGKDWNPVGFEHRFYQAANKYTGLFWPAPPNGADNLTKLNVISVEAFKRQAKQRGSYIDLKDAKVPESGDYRPLATELNKRQVSSTGSNP